MSSLLAVYSVIDAIRDIACLALGFAAGTAWCSLRDRARR